MSIGTTARLTAEDIATATHHAMNRMNNGIETMKSQMTKRAKKQIDELIEQMKTKDFLHHPVIQNLMEKVNVQKKLAPKVEEFVDHLKKDVAHRIQQPVKRVRKVSQQVQHTSQEQLLELIKTSDVAYKIVQKIVSSAGNINSKWLENSKKSTGAKSGAKVAKKSAATKTTKKKAAAAVTKKTTTKKAAGTKSKKKSS